MIRVFFLALAVSGIGAVMIGCGSSSRVDPTPVETKPAPLGSDVRARYEQFVEAVASWDWDSQYELQVPPPQRKDCPRTLFMDTLKAALDANPGVFDSSVDMYENLTYQGQLAAGLDRTIIEAEITARNELIYLEFRRVEGQWYFYDRLLEDTRNPLHECNPK